MADRKLFTLRSAVNEALDTTNIAEPAEVAAKVAENVPARYLRAALAEALVPYVAQVNQQCRMHNPLLGGSQPVRRSPKVAAIADWHAAALRDRVHVESGWKLLGDCTFEDLMFAAAERREHARRNAAKADSYDALAATLRAHGAARVADLPVSKLDVLRGVA